MHFESKKRLVSTRVHTRQLTINKEIIKHTKKAIEEDIGSSRILMDVFKQIGEIELRNIGQMERGLMVFSERIKGQK